mgnify:CR=1 FL=1
MVEDKIPDLNSSDIEALYGSSDSHNSESRARAIWKYAASVRISGAP